jgi:hypothetical protein
VPGGQRVVGSNPASPTRSAPARRLAIGVKATLTNNPQAGFLYCSCIWTLGRLAGMTQPDHDAREDTEAMLAAAGITVTEEGKARARARLAEGDARRTPERQAALRAQVGLPPAAAA